MPIESSVDLGLAIRAARRAGKVRIDDLAATARVSKQYASDLENGKPTAQIGLAFRLLKELGITLAMDIPDAAERELRLLRDKVKPGDHPGRKPKPVLRKRTP